ANLTGDDLRAVVGIQRSLALAHAGKFADAYSALDPVLTLHIDMRSVNVVRWLRAAYGLAAGKPMDLGLPRAPAKISALGDPALALAFWLQAAGADPTAQAQTRWHAFDEADLSDLEGILPAVFYIIGRAAGKGDVELWLDIVSNNTIYDSQA